MMKAAMLSLPQRKLMFFFKHNVIDLDEADDAEDQDIIEGPGDDFKRDAIEYLDDLYKR